MSRRLRRVTGWIAILLGTLLAAYMAYGLHLYYVLTEMFSFLGPNEASPIPFALTLVAGVLLALSGVWLLFSASRMPATDR